VLSSKKYYLSLADFQTGSECPLAEVAGGLGVWGKVPQRVWAAPKVLRVVLF